jgi:hypothetical protein
MIMGSSGRYSAETTHDHETPGPSLELAATPGIAFHDHEEFYIEKRSKPFVIMSRA